MAKQTAGAPIPPLQDVPRNADGNPDGNPSREAERPAPYLDGKPVSPGVARSRGSAAIAQGHGQGGGGGGR
jgi:hypothetical protein